MKADIGLIGLAVMGENLALNMESKGFTVAVYNRSVPGEEGVVDRFINGRGKSKRFIGTHSIEQLVDSVKSPHIIMMMVKAGRPVDELISQLLPFLSSGDVIIDGGNSDFHDTERRVKELEKKGIYFVGTGISGGEEGALHGPSVMPGGSVEAWPLVKDILQGISAKLDDGSPCCEWIGAGGAGHFVKMVHNGIEYGDMQLISEAYSLLKNRKGLDNDAMAVVFDEWNGGELDSFLIEITATEGVVHILVATTDVDVVVLHEGSLEELALPVGTVGEQFGMLEVLTLSPSLYGCTHIVEVSILLEVHHVEIFRHLLPSDISVVLYLRLAFLAALGGDEYHTIAGATTIDGRCGSVLEHLDVGDVRGVNT